MHLIRRVKKRLLAEFWSLWFRIQHGLLGGKVKSDYASITKCTFGKNIVFRGALSLSDSAIDFGDNCSIASSSELGAGGNGYLSVADGVSIGPRSIVSTTGGEVRIGSRTSFFSDCLISGAVTIGMDCLFANNVTVLSGTHQVRGSGTIRENDAEFMRSPNYRAYNPISIGDDSWLGANTVILPGVSLGKGTVVGANAVVTKSFPDYAILAGVPAVVIGSRLNPGNVD